MFLYTWVVIIYRLIVSLAGIPGNLLILAVYCNKTILGSAQVFIIALALCDLYSCLIIPLEIHYWLYEFNYTNSLMCKLYSTWKQTGWDFSVCFTTAIAWDRYLAVSKPINGRWTKKKAIKVCVICGLVVMLGASVVPFTSHIESVTITGTDVVNGTRCKLFSNDMAPFLLASISQYIYFFVMLVVTTSLYVKLWNRMNKRRKATDNFGVKFTCSRIKETESTRDRNRLNERYLSNKVRLETEKENLSMKNSSREIEPVKESIKVQNLNSIALPGHSTTKIVDESKSLPSCSSSRPVMTLEGRPMVKQETKYQAKFHKSKGIHDDRNRTPNVGNNMSQVPNRLRPMSRLTKMLILATLVFVCTWTVTLFFYMISFVTKKVPRQSFGYVVIAVLRLTGLINHAINPVLYSFMNPKFRVECKMLLRRLRRRLC
ncbi:Octopamine receptor [Holothuria leucospilota]|uniref:Octopamine receptor n=1 Tax=Holothuria leucospilota TaxID=206669 RepID=A0A9Q1BD41_HOLLE|nr:Octopamine receptor [Holothuria leucospilota]